METIMTGIEAKVKLLKGVNKVANAVSGTLGPQARTVIIQNPMGFPIILNDGVTVARAVTDSDPYVQMGIDLLKQVASEAQERSGDGTTTATLIAQTLCNGTLSLTEKGVSPIKIRDYLSEYLKQTTDYLRVQSTHNFLLRDVAAIAANNDNELGELIAEVVQGVGEKGAITIETSPTTETYIRETSGLEVLSGYAHKLMANSPRGRCIMESPIVVTTTEKIETFNALVPCLEVAVKDNRPIAIFCNDYNPQMLQNLLVNIMQGKVSAVLVKPSGMPEEKQAWLEDIASVTGSRLFRTSLNESITELKSHDIGGCDRIESSPMATVIAREEMTNERTDHIDTLSSLYQEAENDWMKEYYNNRISRLTNGISTIYVGGNTEVEQKEKKERVDDAVNACRLALEDGVIIGGGAALHNAAKHLELYHNDEDNPIFDLFCNGLATPLTTIITNSGTNVNPETNYQMPEGSYFCGITGEVRKAKDDGVFDPVAVTINSLETAVSVATLLLMTDAAIIAPSEQ